MTLGLKVGIGVGVVFVLALVAWVSWGYFSTKSIEMPKYSVLETKDGYEVRQYEGYLIARTKVDTNDRDGLNKGFVVIADYIFGNNSLAAGIAMTSPVIQEESPVKEEGEPIAMTIPVIQEELEEAPYVSFVMPSKYNLQNIPQPNDDRVELVEVAPFKMAVIQFSGFTPESLIAEKKSQLLEMMKRDGLEYEGKPASAYYNPPWTPPFMRRNEVWVKLK